MPACERKDHSANDEQNTVVRKCRLESLGHAHHAEQGAEDSARKAFHQALVHAWFQGWFEF